LINVHSYMKGIFLSVIIVTSVFSLFTFYDINAQEKIITAKSIGFAETTIIEFKKQ